MPESLTPAVQQLLHEPSYCQIATVRKDGSPQVTQVWVDTDGEHVLVNSPDITQKVRNVRRDPRVELNVFDPSNPWRLANIRGRVVEITREGADDLIDKFSEKYTGNPKYQWRQPGVERLTIKIEPERVRTMGL